MKNLSIRKMNELSKKKKKGFTLVELVIVIAIIAILAAIAIPQFGNIRTNANTRADFATAKNIATVIAAGIADETISDTQAAGTAITALTAADAADADVDITAQLDGDSAPKLEPTTNTAFEVEVTGGGNIVVSYTGSGDQVYPAPAPAPAP